ncbi:unnamed protein product [Pleuronectes platessa]|uniref:Uncharacterized protein n=1 Tax=Pleuronectes platessa TaxID=8262 RepID=A0A9N7TXX1_PLEPL|nr:unnamed protein product [Pleuronectes platessa]
MPSSPATITVHLQPAGPRSTIQTRRHSSPQSPSTAAHQDPPRATAAVLVHRLYPMPTRHRVRHHHHDQPTQHRIRHTGSTTAIPGARSTNRNPWFGHRGPGPAGDKAKGFRGRGIGMEKRKEKLEREAPTMIQADLEATLRLKIAHRSRGSAPAPLTRSETQDQSSFT